MQPANDAVSSLHWKVTPPSLSENRNVGLASLDGFEGIAVIVGVGGGVASTLQWNGETPLEPSALNACTLKVYDPSPRFEYDFDPVTGPPQRTGPLTPTLPLRSSHRNVSAVPAVNRNVGLRSFDGFDGVLVKLGAGGAAAVAPAARKTPTRRAAHTVAQTLRRRLMT